MGRRVDGEALDIFSAKARSYSTWLDTPVDDSTLRVTTKRNSSLQGAYLIIAARAMGLDCGPLSGFDNAKVDEECFAAGRPCEGCDQEFFPEGHVKSNFRCNLGYGNPSTLHPRSPRLDFTEACTVL